MNTILLDTDACIEIIRGNPAPVEAHPDANFAISSVTRFEIRSGLKRKKSVKPENRAKAFLKSVESLPFDDAGSDRAAEVRIALERKGKPIGAYDTLIAGQALAAKLPLLTNNKAEFARVPGLDVLGWD